MRFPQPPCKNKRFAQAHVKIHEVDCCGSAFFSQSNICGVVFLNYYQQAHSFQTYLFNQIIHLLFSPKTNYKFGHSSRDEKMI